MKYFFISICTLFVLVFLWTARVHGASPGDFLVVNKEVTLTKQSSPYIFSGIKVENGGKLHIDPGVAVTMLLGAEIIVDGEFIAVGTESLPIIITGDFSSKWQGITFSVEASPAELRYLTFRNFIEPIHFNNHQEQIHDVQLIDGTNNSMYFGKLGGDYGAQILSDISLITRFEQAGREQSIRFFGTYTTILTNRIKIEDGHQFSSINWQKTGIFLEGKYLGAQLYGTSIPYSCNYSLEKNLTKTFFSLIPETSACEKKLLPTIFVPGYGTSLNMVQLMKEVKEPPLQVGWTFSSFLTPSYTEFLAEMKRTGIPVEIAYYDWRLPADRSSQEYLEPIIQRTKKKYGVKSVNIVAHSFGGIVSRTYIQSDRYGGDVAQFIELGTPNQGAAKAYGAWMGAVLPDDWASLYHFLRFYNFWFLKDYSSVQALRTFFPSAKELLPIYPALLRGGNYLYNQDLLVKNETLIRLKDSVNTILYRTAPLSIVSNDRNTISAISLGAQTNSYEWTDGRPVSGIENKESKGDGTVPQISAELSGATTLFTQGSHADLPQTASGEILKRLYPQKTYKQPDFRLKNRGISFLFDCPIDVEITMPNGEKVLSKNPPSNPRLGEVFQSQELLWMIVPDMEGTYSVHIIAKEETDVRWWVERGEIQELHLKKDERTIISYSKPKEMKIEEDIPVSNKLVEYPEDTSAGPEKPLQLSFSEPLSVVLFPRLQAIDVSHRLSKIPQKSVIQAMEKKETPSQTNTKKYLVLLGCVGISAIVVLLGKRLICISRLNV